MNKLKLEDLAVESFDTSSEEVARGTVYGNGGRSDSTCDQRVCECTGDTEWDVSCGTCRYDEDTCYAGCVTYLNCPTNVNYPGC
jgi:hypothetical protein